MVPYHSIYKGLSQDGEYTDYYVDSHTFIIVVLPGSNIQENQSLTDELFSYISRLEVNHLSDLEHAVQNGMRQLNAPVELTLSIGYISNDILYLKTVGDGVAYVRRGNNLAKIISGDQSASGYIAANDLVVFTTSSLVEACGEGEIKKIVKTNNLQEIGEKFNTIHTINDKAIALFVVFKSEPEEDSVPLVPDKQLSIQSRPNNISAMLASFKSVPSGRRYITVAAVIILFAILVWSVLLGYQRRNEAAAQKRIQTSRELITQKLTQSEDVSFLNVARSQVLIAEVHAEFEQLQSKVGNTRKKEMNELAAFIKAREEKILKKEEKNAEEFYDLTIDSKQAKGSMLAVDRDTLAILDKENGLAYVLSLSKKSLEKRKFSQARETTILGMYQDTVYAYVPGQGVFKITEDKSSKVIDADKDWEIIADVAFYNDNLYLLDIGKDQVHKYVAVENGFGAKIPYFKGEVMNFPPNASLAIDSSLYVNLEDGIVKYTGGERDAFSTEFPEKDVTISRALTSKDEEKVYAWDKQKGTIYILGKSGDYERQVQSSLLTKADDVEVSDKKAFILMKEKVFVLSLN